MQARMPTSERSPQVTLTNAKNEAPRRARSDARQRRRQNMQARMPTSERSPQATLTNAKNEAPRRARSDARQRRRQKHASAHADQRAIATGNAHQREERGTISRLRTSGTSQNVQATSTNQREAISSRCR
jgi:hypothetical protein